MPAILEKNHKAFDGPLGPVTGFGAGDAYPQIWLRDSAWIVDAAAASFPQPALTSWLDLHLAHAERGGRLRDWVAKGSAEAFREWAPRVRSQGGFAFDTNSNESDQEPSAALAFCRAANAAIDQDAKGRERRRAGVSAAMAALLRDRTDRRTGLVWSGLTADWGDVSPLYPDQRAIYLDEKTPRTLSLYTNVMVFAALDCLARFEPTAARAQAARTRADAFRDRVRRAFWLEDRGYFRMRLDLDPRPKGFEDDATRFALGGNALAALHGVADDAQAARIFETAERLRREGGFATISTTLIPPYAKDVFQHPAMRDPGQYQNGGEWDWFGAPLVRAEFERGHADTAMKHLDQIASRILAAGPGIHEWYTKTGEAKGSASYAAAAAAIHNAVVKGLLGVTREDGACTVTLRTATTTPEFEIRQRAAGGFLKISQTLTADAIELSVNASLPIKTYCTRVPTGREAAASPTITTHTTGRDTYACTDAKSVTTTMPARIRFPLVP